MTAEIALLNRQAVALAADSAVTLNRPATPKVYNTANKLFMLSKFHPIGIMVYGSASFMSVPWETVIKVYRRRLAETAFDHLIDHAQDFLEFLACNSELFSESAKVDAIRTASYLALIHVKEQIDKGVAEQIAAKGSVDDNDVAEIVKTKSIEIRDLWLQNSPLACFPDGFERQVLETYRDVFGQTIDTVFQQLPVNDVRDVLTEISSCGLCRRMSANSGLVFAGFGTREFLPVVHSYAVDSIVCGKLQYEYQPGLSNDVNETGEASIIPFAQAEIVRRFIQGIDPEYRSEYGNFLRELLTVEYPQTLADRFADRLDEGELRDLQAELIRIGRDISTRFNDQWKSWEHKKFISPVLDIVGDLPKDELAAMAESLVNLTSFKRRITAETETVGGPIDVAVISKGDGFIWIKRKHYFNKELNPAFFANYYRGTSADGTGAKQELSGGQGKTEVRKRGER